MIDVLIAVYNGEKVLPRLLKSLEEQRVKGQILWQDDGSTDHSRDLMPGQEVKLNHTKGAKGNFMSLLAASENEYAMFCDEDDVWHPDKIEKTLLKMQEGERLYGKDTPLLVHTDLRVTDGEGKELHASMFRHQGWDPGANTLNRLLVQNHVTGCTVMVNKALKELLLKVDAEQMFMHDWWAALTAAAFGRVLFVEEPTIDYYQHGSNQVGASKKGLVTRGMKALGAWQKGKERVRLTYRHARAFYEAYQAFLPPEAKKCVENFLAIEKKNKFCRIIALQKGGYLMQSRVTRIGHMIFS
ncbi:MAG: glycosyltransferase family 2 protein [Clostridia bacterium]|nr:glycosyltransferase family 2 protein [Clostridia bacterium]